MFQNIGKLRLAAIDNALYSLHCIFCTVFYSMYSLLFSHLVLCILFYAFSLSDVVLTCTPYYLMSFSVHFFLCSLFYACQCMHLVLWIFLYRFWSIHIALCILCFLISASQFCISSHASYSKNIIKLLYAIFHFI